MSITSINREEILSIISEESSKFQKRASGAIFGKRIAGITAKVMVKVNPALGTESAVSVIAKNFTSEVLPNISNKRIAQALESGGLMSTYAERLASTIHKFVSQESSFRVNELKKELFIAAESFDDRKAVISKIVSAFESDDLNLELSESMNEETEVELEPEENDVVESVSDEVKESISDAEEKSAATRVVLTEFQKVNDAAEEQKKALAPDPEAAIEAARFDSTEFIKSRIPVTATRFALEMEKGSFTKHKLVDMLLTCEDNGSYKADVDFVQKRIEAVKADAIETRELDTSSVDAFNKIFSEAQGDVDGVFSSFRNLGFGRGDEPAAKRDADTLQVIAKMANMKTDENDKAKRINDIEILVKKSVVPIESAESFLQMALENFELKSAKADEVISYDEYVKAVDVREEVLQEYVVAGMEHVPAERAKRLKEINSGLKSAAAADGLRQMNANRLKSIYYKTAQIVKPELIVDFGKEATRVKEMLETAYSTKDYSDIVDDFFSGNPKGSHLSEENLYEVFAFKSSMKIATESHGSFDENDKRNIKAYAAVHAGYYKSLEALGIIGTKELKELVRKAR